MTSIAFRSAMMSGHGLSSKDGCEDVIDPAALRRNCTLARSVPQAKRKAQGMRPNPTCLLWAATIGTIATISTAAYGQLPPAHPGPTVNDYTAAQFQGAAAAARAAGYNGFEITAVQDGNFFLRADKAGQRFFLTVTPDGKVYPSAPLPSAAG